MIHDRIRETEQKANDIAKLIQGTIDQFKNPKLRDIFLLTLELSATDNKSEEYKEIQCRIKELKAKLIKEGI